MKVCVETLTHMFSGFVHKFLFGKLHNLLGSAASNLREKSPSISVISCNAYTF